jgi:NADH pyrophosphatase NudC (nudix superfamily)
MKIIDPLLLNHDFLNHSALFFINERILVEHQTASPLVPFGNTVKKLALNLITVYLDKTILIVQCKTLLTFDQIINTGFCLYNTKTFLGSTHQEEIQRLILRAVHWLTWDSSLQYCTQCGNKIEKILDALEKKCLTCNISFYPKLSPATMVLIKRRDEILLARSPHFRPNVYSVIAGFIEIGETAERAAHREVKEEVGVEICNLQYFGTQSWPFPDSFIIAFEADYLSGEINIDNIEIEDARWFNINNLPELPLHSSISRKLIDSFILKK